VKSYLLSHGYKDTLSRIDKDFTSDNLLRSPTKKSKSGFGMLGRTNRGKQGREETKNSTKNIWSLEEKSTIRTLLLNEKDFEKVKEMLIQKEELSEELKLNLDLRIFLRDYYSLTDENQKIVRLEQEKDLFSFYRDSFVIGYPQLKSKKLYLI
jgi:hypothetical protein